MYPFMFFLPFEILVCPNSNIPSGHDQVIKGVIILIDSIFTSPC